MARLHIYTLSVILMVAIAQAADKSTERTKHPLTDLPPAGDVVVAHYFPKHPQKQFPAGEEVPVVLGLRNKGSEPLNVTAVMGSLNSPMDFKIYLQNFSYKPYFLPLAEGEELSVEYVFRPDPLLSPREFTVALTVFYDNFKDKRYSTTFFNSTVDIRDQNRLVDTDLIFMYLTLAAIAGGIGFWVLQQFNIKSFFKKSKKTTVASGTKDDEDEWIKGTAYAIHRKKKAARAAASAKASAQ